MIVVKYIDDIELDTVLKFGLKFPEIQVTDDEPFATWYYLSSIWKNGVILAALDDKDEHIVGFIAAQYGTDRTACLVFLAVDDQYRRKGVATKLYDACIQWLKSDGILSVNCFAHIDPDQDSDIVKFLTGKGFMPGRQFVWMDKTI